MRIQLDSGAKRVLLQALKDGYIESGVLYNLQNGLKTDLADKTDDELKQELLELEHKLYPLTCERVRGAGLCFELNDRRETL